MRGEREGVWLQSKRTHSLCGVDRRKWPPGGTFLSHWGAKEEV